MPGLPNITKPSYILCDLFECAYEYIRLARRPLTGLEQRAFSYLLDIEASDDQEWIHRDADHEDVCICTDILPTIVQALSPDPVDVEVAYRSLEGVKNPTVRGHNRDLVRHMQGVQIEPRVKREKAKELLRRAQEMMAGFQVLFSELKVRFLDLGYPSANAMVADNFPALADSPPAHAQIMMVSRSGTIREKVTSALSLPGWRTPQAIADMTGLTVSQVQGALAVTDIRDFLDEIDTDYGTAYKLKNAD